MSKKHSDTKTMKEKPGKSAWREAAFPGQTAEEFRLGPLQVWMRSEHEEVWLSWSQLSQEDDDSSLPTEAPEREDTSWKRWALEKTPDSLEFLPLFPDRPVVVKSEYPFRVPPGGKARIYVRVPLWLKVSATHAKGAIPPTDLCEIPSVIMSSTWFGQPISGELCYSISSSARRVAAPDPKERPHQAICPIRIVNRAHEELHVEKICLRVSNLKMFEHEGQLWGDTTVVQYRGETYGSDIKPTGVAPGEVKGARLVSEPREPITHGMAARTFASLRDIHLLGIKMS